MTTTDTTWLEIPQTDRRYGGKAAQPSPAWFTGDDGTVWFRCQCGDILGFSAGEVDVAGTVSQRISHACGFNRRVILKGWNDAGSTG